MSHWYIMIIYITHAGVIDPAGYTVADLYSSQSACVIILNTIRLSPKQHGLCLPVATMSRKGITLTQEDWLRELIPH